MGHLAFLCFGWDGGSESSSDDYREDGAGLARQGHLLVLEATEDGKEDTGGIDMATSGGIPSGALMALMSTNLEEKVSSTVLETIDANLLPCSEGRLPPFVIPSCGKGVSGPRKKTPQPHQRPPPCPPYL